MSMPSSLRFADAVALDAGPALALARVGLLHLPGRLFSAALLPRPGYSERQARPDREDARAVSAAVEAGTLKLADIPGGNSPPALAGLGAGEIGVIRLCLEHRAVALLDDKLARRAATNAGLRVLGTIGLLRLVKQQDKIKAIGPVLAAMTASGYFLADELIEATLRAENE